MPIYRTQEILTRVEKVPRRVVSLVPSISESLFEFGLADRVVGTTDYCPLPTHVSEPPQRLGGTKNPDLQALLALEPDLVIANQEENGRQALEALDRQGCLIWLTFPTSVREALEDLWALARLFAVQKEVAPRLDLLERTMEWTALAAAAGPGKTFFCPIWFEDSHQHGPWWMTFNAHTYAGDLLARCGGVNVFAERERRYPLVADLGDAEAEEPGERDVRYPRVSAPQVVAAAPQIILLPSEPYGFSEKDEERLRQALRETPAVREGAVYRVDGRLITWHGIRLGQALAELPALFQG